MAKDKKKKADKPKKAKQKEGASTVRVKKAKAGARLKSLADNPMVADVVAAALVATAAALKDSKKARQIANEAGDEIAKLKTAGSEQGSAMWDLALEIGRRAMKALVPEPEKAAKRTSKSK